MDGHRPTQAGYRIPLTGQLTVTNALTRCGAAESVLLRDGRTQIGLSSPKRVVDRHANPVLIVRPQVPIRVERVRCGRVSEEVLDALHRTASREQQRRRVMPQSMRRWRRPQLRVASHTDAPLVSTRRCRSSPNAARTSNPRKQVRCLVRAECVAQRIDGTEHGSWRGTIAGARRQMRSAA